MKLVKLDDVLELIDGSMADLKSNYENSKLQEEIKRLPTVDAELRHGHWIRNDNGTYSCSKCQSWIPDEQHYYARYCLFCGAMMDEVTDNA